MIKLRLKERFIHATGCGHGWELGAMEWNRSGGYKEDIPATDTKSHSHFSLRPRAAPTHAYSRASMAAAHHPQHPLRRWQQRLPSR
jgi:hypothetical protein